ncbi:SPL family radical SAM protein [Paenibacillus flagellatus]|uniref:Radical SAM protein n=1 Tax=Paenibacillus flagellatus TaxID=2211139 RepID=A0A2V5KV33_9BACL|nr:radical SAM protein [Paenibacillus flagellatus]PYI55917.1 radical SAM protein [Paenibacillus flagellatus]
MTAVRHTTPGRLLNPASGYLTGYSHTLNPYAGCTFACSYCYVRRMPVALFRGEKWGEWVDVKRGAADRLRKELASAKRKGPVTIFMSSATDPYQPAEHGERVTRSLLEAMADEPPDFLFVQTRSPLVTRDIDLLSRLAGRVRVSMTVETDLEPIRRAFSPNAPPIAGRLAALRKLARAGLPTQAAVSPVLPSSPDFARTLADTVDTVCVDDFFMGDGSLGKRTEQLGIRAVFEQLGLEEWYDRGRYLRIADALGQYFPADRIRISRDGFLPDRPLDGGEGGVGR